MGGWYCDGIGASGRNFDCGNSWRHSEKSEKDTVHKTIGAINVGRLGGPLLSNGPMLDLNPPHWKATWIPSSEHSIDGMGRRCDQAVRLR